jgi:hypothetical protein
MHFNTKIRLVSNSWIRGSYKNLTDYYKLNSSLKKALTQSVYYQRVKVNVCYFVTNSLPGIYKSLTDYCKIVFQIFCFHFFFLQGKILKHSHSYGEKC